MADLHVIRVIHVIHVVITITVMTTQSCETAGSPCVNRQETEVKNIILLLFLFKVLYKTELHLIILSWLAPNNKYLII